MRIFCLSLRLNRAIKPFFRAQDSAVIFFYKMHVHDQAPLNFQKILSQLLLQQACGHAGMKQAAGRVDVRAVARAFQILDGLLGKSDIISADPDFHGFFLAVFFRYRSRTVRSCPASTGLTR